MTTFARITALASALSLGFSPLALAAKGKGTDDKSTASKTPRPKAKAMRAKSKSERDEDVVVDRGALKDLDSFKEGGRAANDESFAPQKSAELREVLDPATGEPIQIEAKAEAKDSSQARERLDPATGEPIEIDAKSEGKAEDNRAKQATEVREAFDPRFAGLAQLPERAPASEKAVAPKASAQDLRSGVRADSLASVAEREIAEKSGEPATPVAKADADPTGATNGPGSQDLRYFAANAALQDLFSDGKAHANFKVVGIREETKLAGGDITGRLMTVKIKTGLLSSRSYKVAVDDAGNATVLNPKALSGAVRNTLAFLKKHADTAMLVAGAGVATVHPLGGSLIVGAAVSSKITKAMGRSAAMMETAQWAASQEKPALLAVYNHYVEQLMARAPHAVPENMETFRQKFHAKMGM